MAGKGWKATAIGAAAAGVLVVWATITRVVGDQLFAMEDVGASLKLYGFVCGLGGAGLLLLLSQAPLRHKPTPRLALLIGGGILVIGTFLLSAIAFLSVPVTVGAAIALVMAEMLPHDSPMRDRLAVSLGAMLSMLAVAVVVPTLFALLPFDLTNDLLFTSLMQTLVALVTTRIVLWVALRTIADGSRSSARAPAQAQPGGWPPAIVTPPPGWFWGKLHDPASGTRALGYRYVDPTGGASFHVVADLAALPPAHALHRAGYRGPSTLRLGAHETLHVEGLPADGVAMQQAEFERPHGTVILALTRGEKQLLGLPEAPPWAGFYLSHAA